MIIKWVGGKSKIARLIDWAMPFGDIYVDAFGGSGAILDRLLKTRGRRSRFVYNDKDYRLYCFFKILTGCSQDLAHLVSLTPYSRAFFEESCAICADRERFKKLPDIEKALCFLIANRQCFGGSMDSFWSTTRKGEINYKTWNQLPEYIIEVAKRWKNVYLENLDYKELISKWDGPTSVFYFDPPYEGLEDRYYAINKEENFDHLEMFEILSGIAGSFVISYYGASDDEKDSELLKKYKKAGCEILRKKVKKHLCLAASKKEAYEVLIVKGRRAHALGFCQPVDF